MENDVNLVALAEQAHGAAADCPDFVLLWADEGLGSALVIGGRLHRGFFGGAGRGRLHAHAGRADRPRRRAATATTATRPWWAARPSTTCCAPTAWRPPTSAGPCAPRSTWPGRRAGPLEEAAAGLRLVASRLAVGLAAVASVVDPGLVVLAGGLPSAGGEYLRDLVERELHALTHSRPRVRSSALEGNPVLAGGVDLALSSVQEELFGLPV